MRKILVIALFISSNILRSQGSFSSGWNCGGRISVENDKWGPLNKDRNYTQGAGLSYFNLKTGEWFSGLNRKKDKSRRANTLILPFEFSLQLAGFTPDDLKDSLPLIGDRPYSSLIHGGGKFSSLDTSKLICTTIGLSIGFLGVDGPARKAQTFIHSKSNEGNTIAPFNPAGWHNQISNGGEFTGLFTLMKTKLLISDNARKEFIEKRGKESKFQAAFVYGFNLGYLTQGSAGLNIRLGKINPANFANDNFNVLANTSAFVKRNSNMPKISESYFFVSIIGNATVYNGSLHGQFKCTAYRLKYGETGFLNGQGRVGYGLTCRFFNFAIYAACKSPEFWNELSRIHFWGGFSIGCFTDKKRDEK